MTDCDLGRFSFSSSEELDALFLDNQKLFDKHKIIAYLLVKLFRSPKVAQKHAHNVIFCQIPADSYLAYGEVIGKQFTEMNLTTFKTPSKKNLTIGFRSRCRVVV